MDVKLDGTKSVCLIPWSSFVMLWHWRSIWRKTDVVL